METSCVDLSKIQNHVSNRNKTSVKKSRYNLEPLHDIKGCLGETSN